MHLVSEPKPTQPDPEQVAMSLIDRLIEEAASAQRDVRELEREVHMRDLEIADLRRELDEAEARYDALKAVS